MPLDKVCIRGDQLSALKSAILTVFLALCTSNVAKAQSTIHVPADRPTIQAAITAANNGDTVLVAPGTYQENLNFLGKAITVTSDGGPTVTTIDARRNIGVQIGPGAAFIGFTIRNAASDFGAGMVVSGPGSLIKGNIFDSNTQTSGGFGAAIGGNGASPRIEGNLFRNNSCDSQYLSGVVAFVNSSSPTIVNNIFEDNPCRAINMTLPVGNTPHVVNNTIVRNQTGIRVDRRVDSSSQVYENNVLFGNQQGLESDFGTDAYNPTWRNNLVFGNTVDYQGISAQTGVNGNISADPLFGCSAGQYPLRPGSPAIDSGDSSAPGISSTDFGGLPRIVDGNGDNTAVVDIGAFEFSGTPVINISQPDLTYANQLVGTSSTPRPVTLTNLGTPALSLCSITSGADFSQTNNCGFSLVAGNSCIISVAFQPTVQGNRSGQVTIASNAAGSPHTINLSGVGVNPLPTLGSLAPSQTAAGGPAFSLTVTGTNFVSNSTVQWNGAARTTTFMSSTQLKAAITVADIATGGTVQVTVSSPAPGGGLSSAQTFTINNVVPTLASLSPIGTSAAGTAFTLTVTGSGFVSTSVVQWNSSFRITTFLSSSSLQAAIPASDIVSAGTAPISVFNPTPGGGTSNSLTFIMDPPGPHAIPTLSSLSPASATVGGPGLTLTINGANFVSSSTMQWNGAARPTTFVSGTQLQAAIFANDIAATGIAQVTVFSPAPGGGVSNAQPFTINNALPVLTSLSPASTSAGGAPFTLTIAGSGFVSTSQVLWNGVSRATTFISSTSLQASILASDVAVPGTAQITVFNAIPGGGTSNGLTFTTTLPAAPTMNSLSPASSPVGSAGFNLMVIGTNFVNGSTVLWNGAARTTSLLSSTQLTAAIPASDLSVPGLAQVQVMTPSPGGGISSPVTFPIFIGLQTNDLIFDKLGGKIYASVPSSSPVGGNSIVPISPLSGSLGQPVFMGSEPGKLANSDDGQYIYASLDGTAAVRRFDLASQTAALQFALGSDSFFGPYYVEDMAVLPGNAHAIAVSRKNLGISPRHAGVAIYDDGVARANVTPRHTGSNVIEFSASASTFYGYNNETTEFGFRAMAVDANGVTVTNVTSNLISGFGVDIRFDNGLMYATNGAVVDSVTRTLKGTFAANGLVAPDSNVGRTFFASQASGSSNVTLQAFDQQSFLPVGSLNIPGVSGAIGSLIRWGTNGIAFRTSAGQVFIIPSATMVTSLSPPNATAGGSGFTLTINGSDFAPGMTVQWNGSARATTFHSSTQLTASILASDIATVGTAQVTAVGPANGTTSNAFSFTIYNPSPAVTSLAPSSATAGGAAFTLTVNGTNFAAGSAVQWKGASRTTTFVSGTQLTAAILAGDIAAPGTVPVTVFNPTPGGGTSNAMIFTIRSPEGGGGGGGGGVPSPFISPSVTSLAFSAHPAGALPPAQTFTIANSAKPLGAGPLHWTAKLIFVTGSKWLEISPLSGTDNDTMTVSVTGTVIATGNYGAIIQITDPNASNSPKTVPVTLAITTAANLSLSPASLKFSGGTGSNTAAQTVDVTSSGDPFNWTASASTTSGGNWLSISSASGTTPSNISVSVNTAGLAAGMYQGTVTVSSVDAGIGPQTVGVTLTLGTPAIALNPASLLFLTSKGKNPAPQTFQVQNSGDGVLPWTATAATQSGGNWLSIGPSSGTAPSTVTVTVNSAGLAAGAYKGAVTIASIAGADAKNSPQTLAVYLAVDAPVVSHDGVVNGASFSKDAIVSPGSIVSLFGSNLSSTTAAAAAPRRLGMLTERDAALAADVALPTTLGGTQVLVNEVAAGLFYVSPTQINFQMPSDLSGSNAQVSVVSDGVSGLTEAVRIQPALPGIFTTDSSGSGQGAILIASSGEFAAPTGSIPGRLARPAHPGEIVSIYCTGLGPATNQPPSGAAASDNPLSVTALTPTVTIGTIPAKVSFSGLAPGFVGLYQVNVQVPENVSMGNSLPVVLTTDAMSSNAVSIAVQ